MALWKRGRVEQWHCGRGTVEQWLSGTVEDRRSGSDSVALWKIDTLEQWHSGTVEQWNSDSVEQRQSGSFISFISKFEVSASTISTTTHSLDQLVINYELKISLKLTVIFDVFIW